MYFSEQQQPDNGLYDLFLAFLKGIAAAAGAAVFAEWAKPQRRRH